MVHKTETVLRTLSFGALAAAVAACGGLQQLAGSPPSVPVKNTAGLHGDLLYVSDAYSPDVYMLSYPGGHLVQTLTGLAAPQGLCVDRSRNVYVTDQGNLQIVEYAHGGTTPIKTLRDTQYPIACSIDLTTGNLAVANESGNVSVYPSASGAPTTYSVPFVPLFCAYDDLGNLFADSSGAPGVPIAELQKGGNQFQKVTYGGGNVGSPAGLQWVGNRLAVGTASTYQRHCCGKIYRFAIRGTHGRRTAITHVLGGEANFFIDGPTVIVASGFKEIALYNYPEGGHPIRTIKEPGIGSYGVVVSAAVAR